MSDSARQVDELLNSIDLTDVGGIGDQEACSVVPESDQDIPAAPSLDQEIPDNQLLSFLEDDEVWDGRSPSAPDPSCAAEISESEREWYLIAGSFGAAAAECAPSEPSPPILEPEQTLAVPALDSIAEDQLQQSAVGHIHKRLRLEAPLLPWETQPFAAIFGGASWHDTLQRRINLDLMPGVGSADVLKPAVPKVPAPKPQIVAASLANRLHRFRPEASDEGVRNLALAKLKVLITSDPLASELGKSLIDKLGGLVQEAVVAQSFADAFRAKASSTLNGHACALTRFSAWCARQAAEPLRVDEEQLYAYLCEMRSSNRGATSGNKFLQSLTFLEYSVGLIFFSTDVAVSARVRGVARDMALTKAPLSQRPPLTVEQVAALEALLVNDLNDTDACVLGQILFAVHSAGRWRDIQGLQSVEVSEGSETTLLLANGLKSKTLAVRRNLHWRLLSPFVLLEAGAVEHGPHGEGSFNPDLPPARRVEHLAEAIMVGSSQASNLGQHAPAGEDSASSDDSDAGIPEGHGGRQAADLVRGAFPDQFLQDIVVHRFSGISHVVKDSGMLWCHRPVSSNYTPLSEAGIAAEFPTACHQCSRALGLGDDPNDALPLEPGQRALACLDSSAYFLERLAKVGLSNELRDALARAGYTTFGALAFAVSSTPGAASDEAVSRWAQHLADPLPSEHQMSVLRRLLFEAQSMSIAEMRDRVNQAPGEAPTRKLPMIERAERLKALRRKLPGLILTPDTLPANRLVDNYVDQLDSGVLSYVKPDACISRAQEMDSNKRDPTLQVQGNELKLAAKQVELRCSISTDMQLRQAWTRRSLAMELAQLASYTVLETWVQSLFSRMQREPPAGYHSVSLSQVMAADRELFQLLSHNLMGQIQASAGAARPLDLEIESLSKSTDVLVHLLPLVKPPPMPHPTKRPHPDPKLPLKTPKGKGKGKATDQNQDDGKAPKYTLPDGCVPKSEGAASPNPILAEGLSGPEPQDAESFALNLLAKAEIPASSVAQLSFLLPCDSSVRPSSGPNAFLFSCGAYVHGGVTGTFANTRTLPACTQLLARFAKQFVGDSFPFTSLVLLRDNLTHMHRDRNNTGLSALIRCSDFEGGGLWVADPKGSSPMQFEGKVHQGSTRELDRCLYFDPRLLHCTLPWSEGPRIVLAAYSVRDACKLPQADADLLLKLGFVRGPGKVEVPSTVDLQPNTQVSPSGLGPACSLPLGVGEPTSPSPAKLDPPAKRPLFIELFAGSAGLSRAMLDFGFEVVTFDHYVNHPKAPVCKLDLATASGQSVVWDLLHARVPFAVHLTPPILAGHEALLVFCCDIVGWCTQHDVVVSLEQPDRSESWALLTSMARSRLPAAGLSKWVLELKRKLAIAKAEILVKKLNCSEKARHNALPDHMKKVLESKNLSLFEALLKEHAYWDMGVVQLMEQGVDLVGFQDTPSCYPQKIAPATMSRDEFLDSAEWRRRALTTPGARAPDAGQLAHLEQTCKEEVDLGFMLGPYTEDQVSRLFGHTRWSCIRRFVLEQKPGKLRPIDDAKEALVNSASTSTMRLELEDADYLSAMALEVARRILADPSKPGAVPWVARCLDLTKAYKQMCVSERDLPVSVVFFLDGQGKPRYYVSHSLLFGCTSSVFAFNRVSKAISFLLNQMLLVPSSVFYDDFPLLSPNNTSDSATWATTALLDLLGWGHARVGKDAKGVPFAASFEVLGMSMQLDGVHRGRLTLQNKAGRIEQLVALFQGFLDRGAITVHEAQVAHGLLNFSAGYVNGRALRLTCQELLRLTKASSPASSKAIRSFCINSIEALRALSPRVLSVWDSRAPIHIFTDGAWERRRAGIGAVIFDTASGKSWTYEGLVPEPLILRWEAEVGTQLICQIELYAVVCLRWALASTFDHRRLIWWIDNESARYGLIKGISDSPSMSSLIQSFAIADSKAPSYSWYERVPSFSNIADGPSRGDSSEALAVCTDKVGNDYPLDQSLTRRLLSS
ncbi:unnamed protein product [Symbiodinium sp. CCMP2592]|nr:unnamed protein product [Symbiodinium sp. CCMP2592]